MRLFSIFTLITASFLTGCLNPPTRKPIKFYSLDLTPVEISHPLEVLPVQTDAPNKSEIIRRTDGVFINMLDKHRWEQPPSRMLTRVLKAALYNSKNTSIPQKHSFLNVTILSFEHQMPENSVKLIVSYRIEDSARRSLTPWVKFTATENCESATESSVARAMSKAVQAFTKDIAQSCKKLNTEE